MIVTGFQNDADLRGASGGGGLGHKAGGILVGRVCGHLLDEHRRKMAAKLTIGIAAVDASNEHLARAA